MLATTFCLTTLLTFLLTLWVAKPATYALAKLLEGIETLAIVETYARLLKTLVLAITVYGLREALKAEGTVRVDKPCDKALGHKVRGILRRLRRSIREITTLHLDDKAIVAPTLREAEVYLVSRKLGARTIAEYDIIVIA